MVNKVLACSLFAVAGVTSSFASFEMLLAVDFSYGIVRRFDGETGAALGTFGAGYMYTAAAITVNQSLGRAFVYDRTSRNIFSFNYNTGEYIQNWSTGCQYYSWMSTDNSGNIIVCGSDAGGASVMKRFSPTGSVQATYNIPAGVNVFSAAQTADGAVWAISGYASPYGMYRFAAGGGNYTNFYPSGGVTANGGDARAIGNKVYFSTSNTDHVSWFDTASPATISSWNVSSKITNVLGISGGHGSSLYLAGADATTGNGVIYRLNTATGYYGQVTTPMPTVTFASLAVVAAPGPGTWLAIAGGCAAMALRRRKKR